MKKVLLEVLDVSHGYTERGSYAVVLGEKNGNKRLPIVIGVFEAQAIMIAIEKLTSPRPLTHDLYKTTLEQFDISIKEVVIDNLMEGVFYAKLIASNQEHTVEIDSRTSDAIAIALRFDCPIFIYDNILNNAGIVLIEEEKLAPSTPEEEYLEQKKKQNELSAYSIKELEALIDEAIENEEFERAAQLRDEINSRS
ncbi:MAG: bifunctional nuclease family protein [Chitinophagales bacterium]|nr:bifunctional nuclease family protein [Chitinophagales bacterium]